MRGFRRMGGWLTMIGFWAGAVGCVRVQEAIGHADAGTSDGGPGSGHGPNAGRRSEPNAGTGEEGSGGAQAGRGDRGERAGSGGVPALPRAGRAGVAGTYAAAGAGGDFSPWAGGVGGTFPPPQAGGGGVGGDLWWGPSGGTMACDCDDGDPCTYDLCSNLGNCRHDSRVTGPADYDDDGFKQGCDCDDESPEARPTQTQFFSEGRVREWGVDFDFDCDRDVTQLYTGVARDCELHPDGTACLGSGWVGRVAECGVEAPYQVCDIMGESCAPRVAGVVQRCR